MIVEDGTIVANADSYVTVAEADAYLAARGMDTAWALLSNTVKESLLVRAVDYMQAAYRARWKGHRSWDTQSLDWPRQGVLMTDMPIGQQIQYNTIPRELKAGQIELALRQMADQATPLMRDLERGVVSEGVGPLSVTYDTNSPQQVRYAQVENLLAPLMHSSGSMVRLGRS